MNRLGLVLLLCCPVVAAGGERMQSTSEDCPRSYQVGPREELEEFLPVAGASLFALLVNPRPFFFKEVSVAGMLVNGHGRSYLVPLGSRHYLFTGDDIRIDNSQVSECTLEQLDGVPVRVLGVLKEDTESRALVSPVHFLRPIAALTHPESELCCVRDPPPE